MGMDVAGMVESSTREEAARRDVMRTPDEVAAMLELKRRGWGAKRIAREFGNIPKTVRRHLREGCWSGYSRVGRPPALAGREGWLIRHGGNADVVREELASELGITLSLRTVERACTPLRQRLLAEARATMRFETPPGRQLQIDFGERRVTIAGVPVRAHLFVAILGFSRRLHVRGFRSEAQESLFSGMESAFAAFGGTTEELLFDNARALVERHDAATRGGVQRTAARLCPALEFSAAGLRTVSGAHQRQGRAWRRLRQAQRGGRQGNRLKGGHADYRSRASR